MQTPNDRILANIEAIFMWCLMCLGVTVSVAIVVKVFFPATGNQQQPTTTTVNNYFIGNKEVTTNGFPKQFDGY